MKTINKNTCHYPAWLDNPEKWNSHFTRYSGQARVWQNKKAFTLVELIIVITILAILATIAFISFQNFTKDARDGNRITTLKNIESWLSLYNIKSNNYPDPENYIEILSWTTLLIKQWIVWKDVSQKIKLNKEVLDPKDNTNYIYSITWNGKKYQLWTYLEENKLISYIPQITKTYANIDYTKRYFYTIWNKVWILLEDETQKPILKTQTQTWINLSINTNDFKVYFSNDTQSWSTIANSTELIEKIVTNQNTTQTQVQTPTPSLTNVNWTCWMAHNTPTLTQPTENLCNDWNATSVTINTSNYTWSCAWINDWETVSCEAPRQYTVTFDWNWATSWSMTAQNIQANTSVNLTSNEFAKTWNTFAWWSTTLWWAVVYINWQSYNMTTSNITLYAKWEIPTYKQLCTWTPTNWEIYYTDASWNKIASVTNTWTPIWESWKTISNLTCNTWWGTNNGWHIVVCTSNTTWYVLQACNLWNTWTPWATTTSSAYWNVYQWWRADTTFDQWSSDWKSPADSELWWVSEVNKTTATWANSTETNRTKMQWPCPTGYHVPTNKEWVDVRTAWENGWRNWTNLSNALQLPFAPFRGWNAGSVTNLGSYGFYWSSSPVSTFAYGLYFSSSSVDPSNGNNRADGFSVRCFKN